MISNIAPPARAILQEVTEYRLPPNSPITLSDIECAMCLGVFRRPLQLSYGEVPLQLSYGKVCCMSCLCDWVKHTPTLNFLSPPCCPLTHTVEISQLHPAPQVMLKLLDTCVVSCRMCQGNVPAVQHLEHVESGYTLPAVEESGPESTTSLLNRFSSSPQELLTIPTSGRVRVL